MKIAIISDVHGNIDALHAVLKHIDGQGVEKTFNLGDVASGPLWPKETCDLIREKEIPTVRGNHDRQLLEFSISEMKASDLFAMENLGSSDVTWLGNLPKSISLEGMYLCHGTPDSDRDYLLETVQSKAVVPATNEEIILRLDGVKEKIIFCGHTHKPDMRVLPDGRILINPGSVGLPAIGPTNPFPHILGAGSTHARYCTISKEDNGVSSVEFFQVEYDFKRAAQRAADNDRPTWSEAIGTGWMHH